MPYQDLIIINRVSSRFNFLGDKESGLLSSPWSLDRS